MGTSFKKESLAERLSGGAAVTGGFAGVAGGGLLSSVCDSIGSLTANPSAGPTAPRHDASIAGLVSKSPSFGLG